MITADCYNEKEKIISDFDCIYSDLYAYLDVPFILVNG